jgi:hypothetical protein
MMNSRCPDDLPRLHGYLLPPHTITLFPPRSPSHNSAVQVRRRRFFQSRELVNVSSSVLNSEKMLREGKQPIHEHPPSGFRTVPSYSQTV